MFAETQVIPIKPLTLIFGANIAGTSSIIYCLALVHEAQPKILIPNPDVLGPSRVKQALSKHQAPSRVRQSRGGRVEIESQPESGRIDDNRYNSQFEFKSFRCFLSNVAG